MSEQIQAKPDADSLNNAPALNPKPSGVDEVQDPSFDVMRYLQILYIHRWLFASVVLFGLLVAIAFAIKQPKFYKTEFEVFYNESIKEFVVEANVPVIKTDFDKNYWLSVMQSEEMARLTLKNSGLPYNTAIVKRLFKVEMDNKRKDDRVPSYKVTITSKDADIIPIMIKAYIQSLNDLLHRNQVNNSQKLISYLTDQLADNNKKLSVIDRKILGDENGNPGEIRDFNKIASDLSSFRNNLLNAQVELASVQASRAKAEQELKNMDGTIVNETAFSEPLKMQLMNLEVDLARALTKNKEDHPAVKAIRENIVQISNMVRDSLKQNLEIKSLMRNPLKSQLMSKLIDLQINEVALQTQVESLQKVISEFEKMMMPDTTREGSQQILQNRELVNMTINLLNSRLIEAQSAAQGSLSRFVIIDEPEVPKTPANKSIFFFILVGLVGGVALALGVIYAYDMLDNRLMLVSDLERFYALPILGVLLHHLNADHVYTTDDPSEEEQYKRRNEIGEVVVNLRQAMKCSKHKLYSVCSPVRREGKSLISLRLARELAARKQRVCLVDMDFFAPKLTHKLDRDKLPGMSNLFEGECSLADIIQPTSSEYLSFVGIGTHRDVSSFSYEDPAFVDFINTIKPMFDIVLFDTPAVLFIPDTVNFVDQVDGIIVVARLALTSRKSLDKLLKIFKHHQRKITGVIVNDLKINPVNKYSDYYYYRYDYGYRKGKDETAKGRRGLAWLFGKKSAVKES